MVTPNLRSLTFPPFFFANWAEHSNDWSGFAQSHAAYRFGHTFTWKGVHVVPFSRVSFRVLYCITGILLLQQATGLLPYSVQHLTKRDRGINIYFCRPQVLTVSRLIRLEVPLNLHFYKSCFQSSVKLWNSDTHDVTTALIETKKPELLSEQMSKICPFRQVIF